MKEGNGMEYRIGRNMQISASTAVTHAVALSGCNKLAAISLQGIHVHEITANVTNKEAFYLDHRLIPYVNETNPSQDPGILRATLNRDIWTSEMHDVFLDRTISPARTSDEPYSTAFRQVSWSPVGLADGKNCILAAVTADHRVILYGSGRWNWEELAQPSVRWAEYLRSRRWADVYDDENHSEVFSKFKNRCYLLGTVALDWSRTLYGDSSKWAWLVCLQRSGHVVIWKVHAGARQVDLLTFHDLQIQVPGLVKLSLPRDDQHELLLLAGTHQGIIKCYQMLNDVDRSAIKINHLGHVIPQADGLIVGAMETCRINSSCDVVVCTKNNFLCVFSVCIQSHSDAGNQCEVVDQRHVALQSVGISGLCLLEDGRIFCSTEDYHLYEVEANVNSHGKFRNPSLSPRRIAIPANPTMLCRGFGVSGHQGMALYVLESLRVPHDHLQCRQPSNLVVYVSENMKNVLKTIKGTASMESALVALESYKALCGTNYEGVWEPEVDCWRKESTIQLQLVRWFALFKSHACADAETKDELKTRAQIAEFWLRLRYWEDLFRRLLQRTDPLNEEQRLTVHLACEFLTATLDVISNQLGTRITCDRNLVDDIRKKFSIGDSVPEEPCGICAAKVIPLTKDVTRVAFDDFRIGKCVNDHQVGRCMATFRLCFDHTLKCKWCGVHFRKKPVFDSLDTCFLCGGPTKVL